MIQRHSVLVVGGGPAGLISLYEVLKAYGWGENGVKESFRIQLYERRSEVGGVWNYEDKNSATYDARASWPSPAYENLVGNVLPELLQFGSFPIPKPADSPFPTMKETHDWILSIAQPMRQYIRLLKQVVSIKPSSTRKQGWTVIHKDWSNNGEEIIEEWDAIIVAAGPFDHPYAPQVDGLQTLLEDNDKRVMHAKYYRGPKAFQNQYNKIFVIGNANSGNDIAGHLMRMNDGPIYRSVRHESTFANIPTPQIEDVPQVKQILPKDDTLSIILENGRQIDGITKLVLATGYSYDFPWIQIPSSNGTLGPVSHLGAVPNLYAATFCAQSPTLAFAGVNVTSNPIPLSEVQARVIANVFSGKLSLPQDLSTSKGQFVNEKNITNEPGGWRSMHMLRGPTERQLCQFLSNWLERDYPGSSKGLFRWDEVRENVAKSMRATKEAHLRKMLDH